MNSVNSSRKKNRVRELIDVGGITPFTTIDYPGQLAAVLFLQGCPWRCQYCHNSELIHRRAAPEIPWSSAVKFLQFRGHRL
jgi:pyruvate formate lyase activating enzyme